MRTILFALSGGLLALTGAINTLRKLGINPAATFGLLDWTVYVMFVVVLGGIGRTSGPIIGTVIFAFREMLATGAGLHDCLGTDHHCGHGRRTRRRGKASSPA